MKICVIGAGPSGLTTVKQLLDEGHTVRCFERGGNIGGIWQRSAGPPRSFAIRQSTADMLPPTLLPATPRRCASMPSSSACAETHFAAA